VDQFIDAIFRSSLLDIQIPAAGAQRSPRELFEKVLFGTNPKIAVVTPEHDRVDEFLPKFSVSSRKVFAAFWALWHLVASYIRSHCEVVTTSVKLKTSIRRLHPMKRSLRK
jgi:hypothetical protein